MRRPEPRAPRLFGRRQQESERVRLLDVARALLVDDDGRASERVAAALARERQHADVVDAERAEAERLRKRHTAAAEALRRHVERHGSWFPGDMF